MPAEPATTLTPQLTSHDLRCLQRAYADLFGQEALSRDITPATPVAAWSGCGSASD